MASETLAIQTNAFTAWYHDVRPDALIVEEERRCARSNADSCATQRV